MLNAKNIHYNNVNKHKKNNNTTPLSVVHLS